MRIPNIYNKNHQERQAKQCRIAASEAKPKTPTKHTAFISLYLPLTTRSKADNSFNYYNYLKTIIYHL